MNQEILRNIVQYGQYYNPASSHYNTVTSVICDRCLQNNLTTCIGWDKYDLCLRCVYDMTNTVQRVTVTNMEQNKFHPVPMYLNNKSMDNDNRTYMMQNPFI